MHAVVSRGGRLDLAGEALTKVTAATLLIVGGNDPAVRALNEAAYRRLQCLRRLEVVPGATTRAALQATRARKPARVVPVAAPYPLCALRREADDVVCLDEPENFMAVGQFYRRFAQLWDTEVTARLTEPHTLTMTG